MLEKIVNFITSNPAISISLVSLLLSIYNFMYNLVSQKCNIKIVIHNHLQHENTHQFHVTIQNCSQLPISISSICINKFYFCVLEPTLVKEVTRRTGNIITSREETKTIPFPINLNSLQSYSGYLEFRNIDNFEENNFSFSVFTNRKAILKAKIITNDDLTKML